MVVALAGDSRGFDGHQGSTSWTNNHEGAGVFDLVFCSVLFDSYTHNALLVWESSLCIKITADDTVLTFCFR